MTAILDIKGLDKFFGGVKAIQNFSVELPEFGIYGLIGPNGAGKTTIFNTITGIYRPTGGSIRLQGRDAGGQATVPGGQPGSGPHLPEHPAVHPALGGGERLHRLPVGRGLQPAGRPHPPGRLPGQGGQAARESLYLLDYMGLSQVAGAKAGSLPYGHQRKLEIARALALNPRLLLLDEPAAGMSPDESGSWWTSSSRLHAEFKLSILMIEHHMDAVMKLCQHITVLNFGLTTSPTGTPAQIHPRSGA